MKKILTFVSILSFGTLFGQEIEMNKWSLGLGFNTHYPTVPVATSVKLPWGLNGNVRYMFNSKFGLSANMGYDKFSPRNENITSDANVLSSNIQGVINLTDVLGFDTWTKTIGLQLHAGAGLSNLWSADNNAKFGKGDKFINFTGGISPVFRLGDRVSLFADLSFIGTLSQSHTFDYMASFNRQGFDAYYLTQSIGLNVYLGSSETHADFTPTGNRNAEYEARLDAIEQGMKDDDNDGVANYLDKDNNTPEGATVNTKGEEVETFVDTDGDGVGDEFDACPETAGLFSANGCPDADGDGVADDKDNCPNEAGVASEGGCPSKGGDFGGIMPNMMVNFDLNKSILKEGDKLILKNVAKVMKDNPSYKLIVDGHTDNSGTEKYNQNLSKQRAAAVMNFLTTQGVESSRVTMNEYGETQPIASNKSAEGRAINRRAEFSFAK